MSISTMVRIGTDTIDITNPADVVAALKKMQLKLAAGGVRQTVRIDGEEVTYQSASDSRLAKLIAHYEGEVARLGGGRRQRFAKRFTFR